MKYDVSVKQKIYVWDHGNQVSCIRRSSAFLPAKIKLALEGPAGRV